MTGDRLVSEIPDYAEMPWQVGVSQVGTGFHVGPHKDWIGVVNWALVRPGAPLLWRPFSYLGRMLSCTYIRREYPKRERSLRVAIAECERYCEIENANEAKARELLARRKMS